MSNDFFAFYKNSIAIIKLPIIVAQFNIGRIQTHNSLSFLRSKKSGEVSVVESTLICKRNIKAHIIVLLRFCKKAECIKHEAITAIYLIDSGTEVNLAVFKF